jgi:DNA topoisomerase-3
MKRFADSIARQKGIKPPAGYAKSGSVCRAFLDRIGEIAAVPMRSGR